MGNGASVPSSPTKASSRTTDDFLDVNPVCPESEEIAEGNIVDVGSMKTAPSVSGKSSDIDEVNSPDKRQVDEVSENTAPQIHDFTVEPCCYYGDLDESGLRCGEGIQRYDSGDIYHGEWKKDMKHGQGIYSFADGSVYEGRFRKDSLNGNGMHIFEDGAFYSGQFKDDMQHGLGTYFFVSGSQYQGQWKENRMEGSGIYIYPNGDCYKGTFLNNEMHGVGVAKVHEGRTVKLGTFAHGRPADVKTTYHGNALNITIPGVKELQEERLRILKIAPTDAHIEEIAQKRASHKVKPKYDHVTSFKANNGACEEDDHLADD